MRGLVRGVKGRLIIRPGSGNFETGLDGRGSCCLDPPGDVHRLLSGWPSYLGSVMFRCKACYLVLLLYLENPASRRVFRGGRLSVA